MRHLSITLIIISVLFISTACDHEDQGSELKSYHTPKVANSKQEFCRNAEDFSYFQDLASSTSNRMLFRNRGGMANGGVCWWHSRLQRSAIYLGVFKPRLPKPSLDEAKVIIYRLVDNRQVVEIPGYHNFSQFASAWQNEIQEVLERWQQRDGIYRAAWITGLSGESEEQSGKLKQMMDELYNEVHNNQRISYVKLQIPGIESHAWLIHKMSRTSRGYRIFFIDSNFPGRQYDYEYNFGDTSFNTYFYNNFVPYLEQTDDF